MLIIDSREEGAFIESKEKCKRYQNQTTISGCWLGVSRTNETCDLFEIGPFHWRGYIDSAPCDEKRNVVCKDLDH